uniref:Uncharacterized protein n=1 Tax=Sphaeramia orbicularis TaxID=375764 RepID=A0A672ZD86_9TELE
MVFKNTVSKHLNKPDCTESVELTPHLCCSFQGHVETIFDCKFKPDDPNLLATASFDGTIKIWDTNTLTAVSTSPGNEGVVYSLSWAPGRSAPGSSPGLQVGLLLGPVLGSR